MKPGLFVIALYLALLSGTGRIARADEFRFGFEQPQTAAAELHAFFMDVGQGDSELILLPNGKTALIDGGPDLNKAVNFLNQKGIKHLDYVVLTHPHSDHYNGLVAVFDQLQVDNFYDNHMNENRSDAGQAPGNQGPYIVRDKAQVEPGCQTHYPRAGDTLDWDPDVAVQVLNSCPDTVNSTAGTDINNCSIVLRVTYHHSSILFQGDAQQESISRMIRDYGNNLESAALKVGHHGSKNGTTTAWISRVKPKEAFIEVGKGNTYGHPTNEALTILNKAGVNIHRTDLEGTLEYLIR